MSSRISKVAFDPQSVQADAIAEACCTGICDSCARASETPPETARSSIADRLLRRFCVDEELAAQLKSGDADALTEIFRRHGRLVFAIARRILGNADDAEDATQQVFLDAFRAIAKFDPEKGAFKPWLLMFAYHRAFNFRRALIARRQDEMDPLPDALEVQSPLSERLQGLSHPDRRIFVEQALEMLSARQRRTIKLVYFDGLTADEVAARTGETVRMVRHSLYRGLERMRKRMCERGGSGAKEVLR